MACDQHNSYRNIDFSEQTPLAEFYAFGSIRDLILRIEQNKEEILRCRTVGLLHSINGHYYLSDIGDQSKTDSPKLLVSIAYLKTTMPSSVVPNGVQIFGTIQWQGRPVLVIKILQVYSIQMATRLKNAITGITNKHIANVKTKLKEDT